MANKYKKGIEYDNIQELSNDLMSGKYVYWIDRPKHPSILQNMSLRTLLMALKSGMIYKAELNKIDSIEKRLKAVRKNKVLVY